MRVTVLGTGIMGAPMARNIAAAGHDVRAWNRTIEKARGIDGVEAVEDPVEAVRGAEVVITMLADGDAVLEVLRRTHEAIDGVLCQMSTIGVRALEAVEAFGLPLVDAPVSGTRQPAEKGELVVFAAGPDELVERCQPVFEAIASKVVRLGAVGEGTRLKLVLNHWLLGLLDTLAETIQLSRELGVDPTIFLDTIRGGPLGVPYADLKGKAMIEGAYSPPAFPLRLARKDADLVLEAVEQGLIRHVREHLARAEAAGHGDDDMAAIAAAPPP
jgi:3-hydroxyisobutyrate dehydrogenase